MPRSAQSPSGHCSSRRATKCPVGLFGFTRTIGAGSLATLLLDRMEIDTPRAMVVKKPIMPDRYRFERGKIIEQWIRRAWHQNFIARIAQQFEEPRIRFARAGRHNDPLADCAPYSCAINSREEGSPKGSGS